MKLCKDCKHVELGASLYYTKCAHPNNTVVIYNDLVFGEKTLTYRISPAKMREYSWLESIMEGACGKAARWFEPKPIECEITLEDGELTLTRVK